MYLLTCTQELQQSVAIKEFNSLAGRLEDNEIIREEVTAWDIYLNGSREARMMHHLKQEHVLNLIGLAFQPLRLVLELAPMGDLKACMKPFKRTGARLNRRTLRAVMFQVRMAYIYTVFCPGYLEWWLDSTLHLVLFIQYILNSVLVACICII